MRSFLTAATLLSALFMGSTAMAVAPHLHAKLTLPPGWHQQIGQGYKDAGRAYGVKLYNPTIDGRAIIEVFQASDNAAFDACELYAVRHHETGSIIGHAMQSTDETQCGFAWANVENGWGGFLVAQYHDEAGTWNVVIRLNYSVNTPTEYWLRDAKILSESFELEQR